MYEFLMDEMELKDSVKCTSLPGQEAAYSAASFSDIPACVLSRLNLTAEKSCSNDNETASCHDSQSGMTFAPLTGSRGEDSSMLYARESHVKKSALPAKVVDSLTPITTQHFSDWFVKFDRHKSSWKTAQCLLFEDLEDCLDSWPQAGMMQDGICFQAAHSERPITVPAFGFWVSTPCKTESKDIGKASILAKLDRGGRVARNICGRHWLTRSTDPIVSLNPCFAEWMMDWPTGWTDLKQSVTAKFQQWLHSHGEPCHNSSCQQKQIMGE